MTDQWEWWRRALAGDEIGGPDLPVHADQPESGFYRMETGAGWVPVAYWQDSDGVHCVMRCLVDGRATAAGNNIWLRVCEHPITEAAYNHARDTGDWGDVDPATADATAVLIEQNEVKGYAGQVALAAKGAGAYREIRDDDTAARAQSLRAKLLELSKAADKRREELKRPHWDAGKAVDAQWQPIIREAKAGADAIARALTIYETRLAEVARETRVNEPLPTQIKGGYGRAAAIKDVREIDAVTDWEALFLHYVDDGSAREYIRLRAEREIGLGGTPPGVTVKSVRRVGAK